MATRTSRWWKRVPLLAGLLAGPLVALGVPAAAQEKEKEAGKKPAETVDESAGEMVTTPSGLRYQDQIVGEGEEAVKGKRVKVHYTGWLSDRTIFDTSRGKKPFQFRVGRGEVIKGWDEGVVGMKVGGKRTLIIPAKLGYGSRGAGGGIIPPGATLLFEVELLEVK